MTVNFGNNNNGNEISDTELRDCVKKVLFESNGDVEALKDIITETINEVQIQNVERSPVSLLSSQAEELEGSVGDFKDGLPIDSVLPSSTLRPPINVTKTATDIVNDLKSRCLEFFLNALDQIDPSTRLDQLLDIFEEFCNQNNFSGLRKIIDKIQQTKKDIIRDVIDDISDPFEKAAKLNDMLVDAINSSSQDAIENINGLLDELKFQQLYDYINNLDPAEAVLRLQEEIRKRTQIKDFEGVREALSALRSLESSFDQTVDSLLTPINNAQNNLESLLGDVSDLFDLPEEVLDSAQDRINDALDLRNFNEIDSVITALENIQNNILSTLQDLDPQTLLNKGIDLLNEALEKGDLGRYNRILDDLAQQLCTSDQLDALPSLPDIDGLI